MYLIFGCVTVCCRIVKMYQKLHKAMGTLEYFTVRSWEWTHRNMDMLKGKMSEEDIKVKMTQNNEFSTGVGGYPMNF